MALSAISLISPYDNACLQGRRLSAKKVSALSRGRSWPATHRFKDARPALRVPALDAAAEPVARVEDVVVPILVALRVRQAVAHHALGQVRQRVRHVVPEEPRRRRRVVVIVARALALLWRAELVEFVLGCEGKCGFLARRLLLAHTNTSDTSSHRSRPVTRRNL